MSLRTLIVSATVASALGFAPSSLKASRSSVSMSIQDLPAVTAPFGFFDPLGLSSKLDATEISRYRECEIKHGRVAMLAAIGILAGEAIETNTPLYGDKIVGPAIYQFQEADQLTGFGFAFFIIGLISVLESWGIEKTWSNGKIRTDVVNGDYNWDPAGLKPSDPTEFATLQAKEINNGRLAMIGVAGMIVQELVNGKGILENLGIEGALPKAFDTGVL